MASGVRLSRFYNYEGVDYIPAPTGGWAPDVQPWELANDQAQFLDNFIIRPGQVMVRGAFQYKGTLADTSNNVAPISCVLGNVSGGTTPWALVVSKQFDATATVDHWNVPLKKPSSSAALAKGNPSHTTGQRPKWCIFSTNPTITTPGADMTSVPGPRYINFNGFIYGITYDAQGNANATATDANNNYTIWKTCLYTLPLTQLSFTQPTLRTNAPQGAFDIKGYQSRIWLLGGVDIPGGLTAHEPCTLFFTNPIPATDTNGTGGSATADWKDPVSGSVNKILMDNNTDDYGVGLATIRNAMLIFRHSSVWILRGSTTANYTIQPISTEVGCLDARSITEVDGGVYFLSHRGLMFTNGTSVVEVESAGRNSLRAACEWALGNLTNGNNLSLIASTALMSDGSLMVIIAVQITNGSVWDYTCGWSTLIWPGKMSVMSRIVGSGFINGNSGGFGVQSPALIVSRRQNYQSYVFDTQGFMIMEDLGSLFSVVTPELFGTYMYDMVTPGSPSHYTYIPARWGTKFVSVVTANRRRGGIMKRYFLDYMTWVFNNRDSHTWTVTLKDADFNTKSTFTATDFVSLGQPGWGGGNIQQITPNQPPLVRENQDYAGELDDAFFVVEFVGQTNITISAPPTTMWELYGVGAEWQPTRDVRTRV